MEKLYKIDLVLHGKTAPICPDDKDPYEVTHILDYFSNFISSIQNLLEFIKKLIGWPVNASSFSLWLAEQGQLFCMNHRLAMKCRLKREIRVCWLHNFRLWRRSISQRLVQSHFTKIDPFIVTVDTEQSNFTNDVEFHFKLKNVNESKFFKNNFAL